jgi:hypothetical protein
VAYPRTCAEDKKAMPAFFLLRELAALRERQAA